jgi:cation/acetate symporter
MIAGVIVMLLYMMKYKLGWFDAVLPDKSEWWFGISPEGFGSVAMLINFSVSLIVMKFTKAPPKEVQDLVEHIRIPSGAEAAKNH